jgi:hypothetical protein
MNAFDVPFESRIDDDRFLDGRSLDQLELEASRRALRLLKDRLGPERVLELIREDVEETDRLWEQWAAESNGEWRVNQLAYSVSGLDLDYWLGWLYSNLDDEHMQWLAHPEHYVWKRASAVFPDADPDQFCITEPMGEYMLRGFGRVTDWEGSEEFRDPAYPIVKGVLGCTRRGVVVARSLGHYRPTPTGFDFKLVAMKPAAIPPTMLKPNWEHGYLEYNRYMQMARRAWEVERAEL